MRSSGFTLVELMIVVVLMGLMAMIAIPQLVKSNPQRAVRGAGDRFVTTYSMAQSIAVRYGRLAQLRIDTTTARFWVEVDTSRTGGVKDTVGVMQYVGEGGLTISSTRTRLCFDARGLPTTPPPCDPADATVTFSKSGRTNTVQITALGKVLR